MPAHPLKNCFRLLAVLLLCLAVAASRGMDRDTRILVVVLDGMRRDQFSAELMPRCYAAAQRGVIGQAHHAALPTVTRVNAATIVTGCFPERHGLVANTIYVPVLNRGKGLSTGSRKNLLAMAKVWGGQLLAVPTLGEVLSQHGQRFLACSSGSSGSATLLNPTGAGAGILHPEFCVPAAKTAHMVEILGPAPPETEPARPAMTWMTNAYLRIGLPEYDPRVTILWFTDPDHTAHAKGIGAAETVAGIRCADELLGRVFDFHHDRGMKVNVLIVADHGFVTYAGKFDVAATLAAKGWLERARPIVVDGAIYLPPVQQHHLAAIAQVLQEDRSIGPIFTAAATDSSWRGVAPGTLSHQLAAGGHPHAAQIIAYPQWTAASDAHGYRGTVLQAGVAGHGSTSPWEINAMFAAFGPDIKAGVTSSVPTSNADLAPTIAYLAGLPVPTTMSGRVLHEILRSGPPPEKVKVRRQQWTATSPAGNYAVTLRASLVEGRRYVDEVSARHE